MSILDKRLQNALDSRKERGILRRLPKSTSTSSAASTSSSSQLVTPKEVDFYTSDYLSLSTLPAHRTRFLERIHSSSSSSSSEVNPGSGSLGSRLLVNTPHHASLETRLTAFFNSPPESGLLFNSGFDANVGFFSSVPGPEDYILYDEYIHASVHDGMRASRVPAERRRAFRHNDLEDLKDLLEGIVEDSRRKRFGEEAGGRNIFIAVEALYSMDGDFAPLTSIVTLIDTLLPPNSNSKAHSINNSNGGPKLEVHLIVDEAHSTGICGPNGRGLVCALGLEDRVTARLHTFGKAMAASGAIFLTTPLIRSYLLNYARTLIYTTSLPHPTLTSIETSLDLLEDGTASVLASQLSALLRYFVTMLKMELRNKGVPSGVVTLPEWFDEYVLDPTTSFDSPNRTLNPNPTPPIIPLLTPRPRPLATYLTQRGLVVRPITYPTVPKGADRVRVCLHAGNTREEVQRLVCGVVEWARDILEREGVGEKEKEKKSVGGGEWIRRGRTGGGGGWEERVLAAKL